MTTGTIKATITATPASEAKATTGPKGTKITDVRKGDYMDDDLFAKIDCKERLIAEGVRSYSVSKDGKYIAFTRQTGGEDSYENEAQTLYLYSVASGKTAVLRRIPEMYGDFDLVRTKAGRLVVVGDSADGGRGIQSAFVIDARDGDAMDFAIGSYGKVKKNTLEVKTFDANKLEDNMEEEDETKGLTPIKTEKVDLDAFVQRNEGPVAATAKSMAKLIGSMF